VKETCGVDITKDNITARIKTFDKHYEVISKMLAQSGFGWDWDNNKVMVDSDEVWSRYVEVPTVTFNFIIVTSAFISNVCLYCVGQQGCIWV
jgi:hypothetical protein